MARIPHRLLDPRQAGVDALDLFLGGASVNQVAALLGPHLGNLPLVEVRRQVEEAIRAHIAELENENHALRKEIAGLRAMLRGA